MIWTVSNMLSFLRLLLAIPAGFALWYDYNVATLCLAIFAVITDILDGYLARKLDQVSEAGKIIDPLADKVFVGTIGVILVIKGSMPVWLGLSILARDIIILIGGMLIARKIKYVIPSNMVGKLTVVMIAVLFVMIVFNAGIITIIWQWLVLAGLVYSLVQYVFRAIKLVNESK